MIKVSVIFEELRENFWVECENTSKIINNILSNTDTQYVKSLQNHST